jgi:hypothetical protein
MGQSTEVGGVTETMVLDSGLYVAWESIAAMLQIGGLSIGQSGPRATAQRL